MSLIIKKLMTNSGYLENAQLEFAPGLNCIIGARGTCKSTIVETIRFLFDADKDRVKELIAMPSQRAEINQFNGFIRATLGTGLARCIAVEGYGVDAIEVVVERDVDSVEPRIFRENVKELSDKRILNKIEIYSQGDLQRIADSGEKRLDLIDKHHKVKIDELNNELSKNKAELMQLGPRLRELRVSIENRQVEIKALPIYQQQLAKLKDEQPAFHPELAEEREKYLERMDVLRRVTDVAGLFTEVSEKIDQLTHYEDTYNKIVVDLKTLNISTAEPVVVAFSKIYSFLHIVKDQGLTLKSISSEDLEELSKTIESSNERYYQLRQTQHEVNEALKQQDLLAKQILHLELINKELEEIIQQENILVRRRNELRNNIEQCADGIYSLRLAEVEKINDQFSENVILTLRQSALCAGYQNKLANLLAGSRLRNREEIAEEIAKHVTPAELVNIIEAGDSQRLAKLLDRDLSQIARLVAYLLDSAEFYEIEGETFSDELDIQLFVNGVPKRVDQLSKGQKATALLPLILRDAPYPLIFDQPEDDLDNRFICETLIADGINKLKGRRQMIFVTHNANIPVLGDAEKVTVMSMKTPYKAGQPVVGTVEEIKSEIISLLEGGEEAFKVRHKKYGII